jgi:hypothetical protein
MAPRVLNTDLQGRLSTSHRAAQMLSTDALEENCRHRPVQYLRRCPNRCGRQKEIGQNISHSPNDGDQATPWIVIWQQFQGLDTEGYGWPDPPAEPYTCPVAKLASFAAN